MRSLAAFTRKEFLESVRTGKLMVLLLIFVLFGIMNPAIAKLTPWLMETMAENMEETGLIVSATEVNAMSSWMQFYKNVPMALLVFAVLTGGIFTGEYERGTLIHMVTKGLERWKVLAAKTAALLVFWSGGYWGMYGITWGYTAYFWDSSEVIHEFFGAFGVYLLGIWMISLILLGSCAFRSGAAPLGTAGGGFVLSYLLGMVPAVREYVPTQLLSGSSLLSGAAAPEEFAAAMLVTSLLALFNFGVALLCFNRKALV